MARTYYHDFMDELRAIGFDYREALALYREHFIDVEEEEEEEDFEFDDWEPGVEYELWEVEDDWVDAGYELEFTFEIVYEEGK